MGSEEPQKFNHEKNSLIPEAQSDKGKFHIERNGRVTTIEAPTASYMILYGNHFTPENPDSIPVHAKAVFLEAIGNWTQESDAYESYEEHTQYRPMMKTLKENGTPIYFGDPDINMAAGNLDLGVLIGETALGIALLAKLKEKNSGEKGMNRRDFLKKSSLAMAGAYFSTPLLSRLGRAVSHETDLGHSASAEIAKKINEGHPESMIILESFRNAVIAYKEQRVAEAMNNKPLIATVMGAMHVGIEDALQSSQADKLEYLRKFKPVLHSLVNTPETFFTIRINNPNSEPETLFIKELQDLWKDI